MPTELTEIENLANETFNAFFNASEEDKTAMRPAFLAANDAMLKEALGDFHNATGRFTDLSVKLLAAIEAVGSPETRDRLERVFDRLGNVQQVVHGREGMRKTWLNAAEEAEGRSDDEDVPPAEERQPIPKPGIVSPAAVPPTPVNARDFAMLVDEYVNFYRIATFKNAKTAKIARASAETAVAFRPRYQAVGSELGMPWWFIAGIHLLESSFNFRTHLHNGDPLTAPTFRRPPNRPSPTVRTYTWEESAIDALKLRKLDGADAWTLARALYRWEVYNGFGYRSKRIPTTYLWSFTNIYQKGKFIADGEFSDSAVSKQCGAADLLKALEQAGHVSLEMEIFTEGSGDDAESDSADAESVVANDSPNIDGVQSTNVDFQTFFDENLPEITHFKWHEFLVKGGAHQQNGLNTDPPRHLWPNVLPVARLLQQLREAVGHPMVLTSVYRSPAYNAAISGAAASKHKDFCATDFKVIGAGTSPGDWSGALKNMRAGGLFEGGIGIYNTFVHVDTRGSIANWDERT